MKETVGCELQTRVDGEEFNLFRLGRMVKMFFFLPISNDSQDKQREKVDLKTYGIVFHRGPIPRKVTFIEMHFGPIH